ncbi:MAG: family 10 glycosylhydrolase [Nitriliruptoraceae bacterium]
MTQTLITSSIPARPPRVSAGARAIVVSIVLAIMTAACGTSGVEPPPQETGQEAAPSPAPPPEPAESAPPEGERDHEAEADTAPESGAPAVPSAASGPWRGAWIHLFDGTLKSRSSIEAAVSELAAAGADTIIAQVARRHDAYYNSSVLPRTVDPLMPDNLDVLEILTDAAHLRGMRVHAWISVAPTWHAVYADLDHPEGWMATTHGLDAPEEDRWVTRTIDGDWDEYLDPGLLEVHDHVAAIATEIVDRYPVDGIHLDYVRYASERHGYHPGALARFHAETTRTDVPEPDDLEWVEWRHAQTHQLIRHVAEALGGASRQVALSAAVVTWGAGPSAPTADAFSVTRPATEALQNWPSWVRDGLVDAVVPMNYFRAHVEEQAAWFDQWLAFGAELATTTDVLIVPGIGGWLNEPDATLEQVAAAMAAGDGAVVYSFQQPTRDESRGVWADLAAGPWAARP